MHIFMIAVDRIYFEESVYEASEGDGVLEVILSRSSRSLHRSRTITIRTRELNIMEAAKGIVKLLTYGWCNLVCSDTYPVKIDADSD